MLVLRPFLAFLTLLALGLAAIGVHEDPEHVKPERGERPTAGVKPAPFPRVSTPDPLAAIANTQAAFFAEQERLEQQRIADYLAAVAAENERQAQEAARARSVVSRSTNSTGVAPSGSCCGPHSDLWWQGVAQCEQGGRNDPYFGYFSFMDGSQGGRPWADQVAAGNALLASTGRESPTWAPVCVARGYQFSPSG